MKISFLLGAGASIKAGMPKTPELTTQILNTLKGDQEFASMLKFCETIFPKKRKKANFEPNYEDFINLILHLEEHKDKFNFEIHPLISKARKYFKKLQISTPVNDIAMHLISRVKEILPQKLFCDFSSAYDRIKYYEPLIDIKNQLGFLNIFTLNHDRSLDEFLRTKFSTEFTNGFEEGSREWNPKLFDHPVKSVRLYKLHGGLGWVQCETKDGKPIVYDDGDYRFIKKYTDDCWAEPKLLFLVGTMRKSDQYSLVP